MPVQGLNPVAEAARFFETGDFASAERILAGLGRDNPDALHLLGLVRLEQERLEEAAALLIRSLAVRPGHPHVLLNLGKILKRLKRDAEAGQALDEAVRIQPDFAEAWYERAEFHHRGGNFASAEAGLRKVLALAPGHRLAGLSLGIVIKDDGRPAEAESLLEQGFAQAGGDGMKAAFAYNIAQAQYAQGRKDAALENFALAERLDPGAAMPIFRAPTCWRKCCAWTMRRRCWKTGAQREPGNAAAHAAFNDLAPPAGPRPRLSRIL